MPFQYTKNINGPVQNISCFLLMLEIFHSNLINTVTCISLLHNKYIIFHTFYRKN